MSSAARLELIAAIAANGVIGRNGQLPWHLPDDLKRFKQLTMGHAIIMGRKTFESIGKALPGRRNIVISSTLASVPNGVVLVRSLDEALADTTTAFVIGGASLYAEAMLRAAVLQLTELDEAVDGDVYFPSFDKSDWRLVHDERHGRDAKHAHVFHFRTYERN